MDRMLRFIASLFGLVLMLAQMTLEADTNTVPLTYVFCDQGIHKIQLNDGESRYFTWNGVRLSKYDFSDCDLWLSGKDRKTSDKEEWTVCVTFEELNLTDCDVKITYQLRLGGDDTVKTYDCNTPPPENYCTKNIILAMGVIAMKDSDSYFKMKMSATQHSTTEDVMFIVKIVGGVIGVLVACCGSGCVICCCCCKDKKSSTSNKKDTDETGEPELQNMALNENHNKNQSKNN